MERSRGRYGQGRDKEEALKRHGGILLEIGEFLRLVGTKGRGSNWDEDRLDKPKWDLRRLSSHYFLRIGTRLTGLTAYLHGNGTRNGTTREIGRVRFSP